MQQKQTSVAPIVNRKEHARAITGTLSPTLMKLEGMDSKNMNRESSPIHNDETRPGHTSAQAAPQSIDATTSDPANQTVLIVEDTAELAEVIQATLESAGLNVSAVSHGAKALKSIEAHTPDLLLLDIGLPDMTGWKLLETLRESRESKAEMPTVVMITAYGDPANRLIGKLQGVSGYLIKPFTPDEVENVVYKALSGEA